MGEGYLHLSWSAVSFGRQFILTKPQRNERRCFPFPCHCNINGVITGRAEWLIFCAVSESGVPLMVHAKNNAPFIWSIMRQEGLDGNREYLSKKLFMKPI